MHTSRRIVLPNGDINMLAAGIPSKNLFLSYGRNNSYYMYLIQ